MSYDQLRVLMEHGDEIGCINMSAFTASSRSSSSTRRAERVYEQIRGRGIELTDDCALPSARVDRM